MRMTFELPVALFELEVDHAFVACTPGAPEADALLHLGLTERRRFN
jgi:hypothetical protein